MKFKRLLYYLLLNILVSACTVLVILYAWETYYLPIQAESQPAPIVLVPTVTAALPGGEAAAPDPPEAASEAPVEAEARPEFISYTVQPGDTISGIAFEFDVSVEDILAANNLDNPDSISVNDVIFIPVGGEGAASEPAATPTLTSTPPPPPTLAVTESAETTGDPELQIVTVIGAGDIAEERVVIRQAGDAQVSLQGWQLAAPDGQVFDFPQLVLFKDGAVTVYTKAGANTVAELFWGLDDALWESGGVVTLLDPEGNIAAAFQVP